MTDDGTEPAGDMKEIESLPLAQRAEAYAALHEEFAARLEAAPGAPA